jgi:predicted small secreted protein
MDALSDKGLLVVRTIAVAAAAGMVALSLAGCNVNRGMEGADRSMGAPYSHIAE